MGIEQVIGGIIMFGAVVSMFLLGIKISEIGLDEKTKKRIRKRMLNQEITEVYQLAFDILREHNAESTSPPEMIGSTFSWGKGHFTTG